MISWKKDVTSKYRAIKLWGDNDISIRGYGKGTYANMFAPFVIPSLYFTINTPVRFKYVFVSLLDSFLFVT